MLEFIFFHPTPSRMFVDWLRERGLDPECTREDEAETVLLPETMDEALYAQAEEEYDRLMTLNEELLRQEHGDDEGYHMAGIAVHLLDGRVSYADIDPELLGRVMGAVTPEEFSTIVDAIVTAVESPQERSYCERQRDDAQDGRS
jgi:hypothetical protein